MKRNCLFLVFLLVWTALASPAQAKKPCQCWIGSKKGAVLEDYGPVAWFRGTESNKKARCSEACAKRCAGDIADHQKLCSWIGTDFDQVDTLGCFSVVGRRDNPNNTWDFDGRPAPFAGCSRCCTCPRGHYNKKRKTCAIDAGCKVPGMPIGDKGGGYFAWDQKLFVDIPGARCRTVAGPCPEEEEWEWSPWLNRDLPSGNGDFELLPNFLDLNQACDNPKKVECRTHSTKVPWNETGLDYSCTTEKGGFCLNAKQKDGSRCLDFEVRFLCPKQ
ncbi:MAG: hypothetical protein K0U98_08675 [Deltaproteobacteria bacterium]|nr:hypothetical protein [Deltaproteobacteria bacterium]